MMSDLMKGLMISLWVGINATIALCIIYRKRCEHKNIYSLIAETRPDLIYVNSLFSHKFVVSALKSARDFGLLILLAPRGHCVQMPLRKKRKN